MVAVVEFKESPDLKIHPWGLFGFRRTDYDQPAGVFQRQPDAGSKSGGGRQLSLVEKYAPDLFPSSVSLYFAGNNGHMKVLQVFLERFSGRAVYRPVFITYECVVFGSNAEIFVFDSLYVLCIRHDSVPLVRYM